jgi:tetratricopeptide (TPR) repeat protein
MARLSHRHICLYHLSAIAVLLLPSGVFAAERGAIGPERLLQAGQELADKTNYLEALDLLEEARDILDNNGQPHDSIYADVLFTLAQTKIKARLHQNFAAHYVKTALQDIQTANKLRERLPDVVPQILAEGFFLEGYIQKRFFMRTKQAKACFSKALKIDPGLAPAKRGLAELELQESK